MGGVVTVRGGMGNKDCQCRQLTAGCFGFGPAPRLVDDAAGVDGAGIAVCASYLVRVIIAAKLKEPGSFPHFMMLRVE